MCTLRPLRRSRDAHRTNVLGLALLVARSEAAALVRINLFGYAIGEVDQVRPLDRTRRGWQWQFNLTPVF